MKRLLVVAVLAVVVVLMMAVPALASEGAVHYTWDDTAGAYGGPAAMVVNNAGAVVWWQLPGTNIGMDQLNNYGPDPSWSKDVYKLKPFPGSAPWPTANLGEPVRAIMQAKFPGVDTVYYTREIVYDAPSFPNVAVLPSSTLTAVGAEELVVQ